jgi:hypothetical protein
VQINKCFKKTKRQERTSLIYKRKSQFVAAFGRAQQQTTEHTSRRRRRGRVEGGLHCYKNLRR